MTRNERKYFDFLVESVELDNKTRRYSLLLEYLYHTPFEFNEHFELDEDRIKIGIEMRENWAFSELTRDARDEFLEDFGPGISALEFFVSMAKTISDILYFDPKWGQFFWQMIENLGLDTMNDDEFDQEIVDNILRDLWLRNFKRDGSGGGLFCVPNCKFDMRKLDFMSSTNLWISYTFVRGG